MYYASILIHGNIFHYICRRVSKQMDFELQYFEILIVTMHFDHYNFCINYRVYNTMLGQVGQVVQFVRQNVPYSMSVSMSVSIISEIEKLQAITHVIIQKTLIELM